jgi:hypothetical protein
MENNTITAKELIAMGYKQGTAIKAIHQSKEILVKQGYTFYKNQRLGRVPKSVVSKVLAVEL